MHPYILLELLWKSGRRKHSRRVQGQHEHEKDSTDQQTAGVDQSHVGNDGFMQLALK
jgi:hypothetical protein